MNSELQSVRGNLEMFLKKLVVVAWWCGPWLNLKDVARYLLGDEKEHESVVKFASRCRRHLMKLAVID